MYTPVETSQVLQTSQVAMPTMSYAMAPEAQVVPQVSYTQGAIEVLPPIYLPNQVSQIVSPAPEGFSGSTSLHCSSISSCSNCVYGSSNASTYSSSSTNA